MKIKRIKLFIKLRNIFNYSILLVKYNTSKFEIKKLKMKCEELERMLNTEIETRKSETLRVKHFRGAYRKKLNEYEELTKKIMKGSVNNGTIKKL